MRLTTKGRRRVEEAEFCRNCNRFKHDEEIIRLTAKVDMLEGYLSESQLIEMELRVNGDG